MKELKVFIGGRWQESAGGGWIDVENPANRTVIGRAADGSAEDVDRAVAAAQAAFPVWRRYTPDRRAACLEGLADYLEAHRQEIADTITAELGAPRQIVMPWHVDNPIAEARAVAQMAREYVYEQKCGNLLLRREPMGVVAAITPWNFPLDQITAKVLTALAAGNTVVLKPSQLTPLVCRYLAEGTRAAGFPDGVFNVVPGRGGRVGEALAAHPGVAKVSFTGSTRAGKLVGCTALDTVKNLTLELGGKSACVLLESGDAAAAVQATLENIFSNSGQICCGWSRLLVPASRLAEVEGLLVEEAARWKVGDPTDETVLVGPVASRQAFDSICGYLRAGLAEGARMLVGRMPADCETGYYIQPVVFTDVSNDMTIAREEIFGPVLCVIPYTGREEALRLANDSIYGLGGAVFGAEMEALDFARDMDTGMVQVNGAVGAFTPFGGWKQSGIGREHGLAGFEQDMEIKSILLP